jgi:hypothetical protein
MVVSATGTTRVERREGRADGGPGEVGAEHLATPEANPGARELR